MHLLSLSHTPTHLSPSLPHTHTHTYIHSIMSKKPRVETVAVYYMVHINYPLKCRSDEVEKQLIKAKNGNPVEVDGRFVRKVITTWHEVFMFEFSSSKRASNAEFTEFTVVNIDDIPTDNLLPPLPSMELCVDLKMVVCSSQQLKTYMLPLMSYNKK